MPTLVSRLGESDPEALAVVLSYAALLQSQGKKEDLDPLIRDILPRAKYFARADQDETLRALSGACGAAIPVPPVTDWSGWHSHHTHLPAHLQPLRSSSSRRAASTTQTESSGAPAAPAQPDAKRRRLRAAATSAELLVGPSWTIALRCELVGLQRLTASLSLSPPSFPGTRDVLGSRQLAVGGAKPTLRSISAKILGNGGRTWSAVRPLFSRHSGPPCCDSSERGAELGQWTCSIARWAGVAWLLSAAKPRRVPIRVQAAPPPVLSPPRTRSFPPASTVVPSPIPATYPASTPTPASTSAPALPPAATAADLSPSVFSSTLSLEPQFGAPKRDPAAAGLIGRVSTEPFVSAARPTGWCAGLPLRLTREHLSPHATPGRTAQQDESSPRLLNFPRAGALGGAVEDSLLQRALQSTTDVRTGKFKDMNGEGPDRKERG